MMMTVVSPFAFLLSPLLPLTCPVKSHVGRSFLPRTKYLRPWPSGLQIPEKLMLFILFGIADQAILNKASD